MTMFSICIMCTDKRMEKLAGLLYNMGYNIYTDIEAANEGDVLIIAPNMFDGLSGHGIFRKIFGGDNKHLSAHAGYVNYAVRPDFIEKNAVLTARGIVKTAYNEGVKINNQKVLVTGYGYCGKAVACELLNKQARPAVMVRKRELKKTIKGMGFDYIDMTTRGDFSLSDYEVVINTVPALVLDSKVIDALPQNVRIYDIASAPGGVDFDYCKRRQIKADIYPGIPGKMYPDEAASAILDTIMDDLNDLLS